MALSSDGRILAVAEEDTLYLYRLQGAERITHQQDPETSREGTGTGRADDVDKTISESIISSIDRIDEIEANITHISSIPRDEVSEGPDDPSINNDSILIDSRIDGKNTSVDKLEDTDNTYPTGKEDNNHDASNNANSMDNQDKRFQMPQPRLDLDNKILIYLIIAYFIFKIVKLVYSR